jgi:hypothetical protein
MVDEDVFYKVQGILEDKAQTLGIRYLVNHPSFYLRRIARHTCGRFFTAGFSKGKSGKRYGYYFCLDHRDLNIPFEEMHNKFKELWGTLVFPTMLLTYIN